MLKDYLKLILHLFKHPNQTHAHIPLSKNAVQTVCNAIDFSRPVVVVVLGGGMAQVMQEIVLCISPTSRLVCIEENVEQTRVLKDRFAGDERVEVVEGGGEDVQSIAASLRIEGADVVLTYVPFGDIHASSVSNLVAAAKSVLKTKGVFITLSFSSHTKPLVQKEFLHVSEKVVWQNIPPLRMVCAYKKETGEG